MPPLFGATDYALARPKKKKKEERKKENVVDYINNTDIFHVLHRIHTLILRNPYNYKFKQKQTLNESL